VMAQQMPGAVSPDFPLGAVPLATPGWYMPDFLVLDIETGEASEQEIEAACRRYRPPSNIKDPFKIKDNVEAAHKKIREKSALLDAAPILCMSARAGQEGLIFNGMDAQLHQVPGFNVLSSGSEAAMLTRIREYLDAATSPETVMVGFNILHFDLPKLRFAYLRHRLPLPKILLPHSADEARPPVDLMRLFLKHFTSELAGDLFVTLDEVTDRLGLPQYKDRVSGSEIPAMAKAGRVQEVLAYSALDCLATWQSYFLMTNQGAPPEAQP
jgi:predicted 3'-5' exonuclease similar to PolB exonuclease domain